MNQNEGGLDKICKHRQLSLSYITNWLSSIVKVLVILVGCNSSSTSEHCITIVAWASWRNGILMTLSSISPVEVMRPLIGYPASILEPGRAKAVEHFIWVGDSLSSPSTLHLATSGAYFQKKRTSHLAIADEWSSPQFRLKALAPTELSQPRQQRAEVQRAWGGGGEFRKLSNDRYRQTRQRESKRNLELAYFRDN